MLTLNLTPEQVNYIGVALGKCPYNEVKDLITIIQSQIDGHGVPTAVPMNSTMQEPQPPSDG